MSFAALQNIFPRRIPLRYVSPAICDAEFSSTGFTSISLNELARLRKPSGPIIDGSGSGRFSWDTYPGAICYSVYRAVDEVDPFGDYILVAECITDTFYDATETGWYVYTVLTPDGETPPSDPIFVSVTPPPPPPLPVVTVEATDDAAAFGDTGVFTVTRTESTAEPLTVLYELTGDAENGVNYEFLTGAVVIPAGQSTATVVIDPTAGVVVAVPIIAQLTITPDAGYVVGSPDAAEVTIDSTLEPISWWRMEEASGSRSDALDVAPMLLDTGKGAIAQYPGHLNNALSYRRTAAGAVDRFLRTSSSTPLAAYGHAGTGVSLAFWYNLLPDVPGAHPNQRIQFNIYYFNTATPANESDYLFRVRLHYDSSFDIFTMDAELETPFSNVFSDWPTQPDLEFQVGWHLFVGRYDAVTQKVGISVDNGAFLDSSTTLPFPMFTHANVQFLGGSGTPSVSNHNVDEAAIFNKALSQAEVAALWNAGAGLTWP